MSAEILRKAAALMRERAAAATEGPWRFERAGDYECGEPSCCSDFWDNRIWGGGSVIAESHLTSDADAEHIASWHPAVALAVADWLDAEAQAVESMAAFSAATSTLVREESFTIRGAALTVGQKTDGSLTMQANTSRPALAFARAYLGESA